MHIPPNRYKDKEWEDVIEPFQMAPNVYYVGTKMVGSYLVDTADGLILIDQAFAESVYIILESIRKLGFDPKNIKKLLVTHGHLDHCGGTRLLQEYTGAKVYMSKEDYQMMRENPFWVHFGYQNWIDFEVDEFFDNNEPVRLGNMEIQTLLTPGHTPGTTSMFFEVKDSQGKIYRCGLHGGLGLNTMEKTHYEQCPGWPKELVEEFIKHLEEIEGKEVDILIPSHPNQHPILDKAGKYQEDNNPFVDQTAWRGMLKDRRERALKQVEILKNETRH